MKKEWLIYAAIFLAGVYLGPKVRTLPVLNRIPSA